jgi:hypothetical protein
MDHERERVAGQCVTQAGAECRQLRSAAQGEMCLDECEPTTGERRQQVTRSGRNRGFMVGNLVWTTRRDGNGIRSRKAGVPQHVVQGGQKPIG